MKMKLLFPICFNVTLSRDNLLKGNNSLVKVQRVSRFMMGINSKIRNSTFKSVLDGNNFIGKKVVHRLLTITR